ncbi:MAG: response regulator [Candidatus Pacebacteria bacterium]|nr:response regulator [Candidatus Paceibacterota bacterium]
MDNAKPLILVTDDDASIRNILHIKLEAAGFRVSEATNGQEAIDFCKKEKPALIVMDVGMPVMSGTETVTAIKKDDAIKDIQIIFLSNFGEENELNAWLDQKFAKELGAVDYMKKSEDISKIIEKITSLVHA